MFLTHIGQKFGSVPIKVHMVFVSMAIEYDSIFPYSRFISNVDGIYFCLISVVVRLQSEDAHQVLVNRI